MGRAGPVVPRGDRRDARALRARPRRSCGPRSPPSDAPAALRGRDPGRGPQSRSCATASPSPATRDLHGLLRVTVFAPDDLELVKGGPAERRDYLDELLAMLAARYDAARSRLRTGAEATQRAAAVGCPRRRGAVHPRRVRRATRARGRRARAGPAAARWSGSCPAVAQAYEMLALDARPVGADLRERVGAGAARRPPTPTRSRSSCATALAQRRRAEIDRGLTLVGPHRDELQSDDRRSRRAPPGVAGRAAHARAGACGSRGTWSCASSPARRRCCCSTTSSASSTRSVRPRSCATCRRARRCSRPRARSRPTSSAQQTLDRARGPRRDGRLDEAARRRAGAAARRDRGGRTRARAAGARTWSRRSPRDWADDRRAAIAAHAQVRSVRDGECTIVVDGPAWATQLRYARERPRGAGQRALWRGRGDLDAGGRFAGPRKTR